MTKFSFAINSSVVSFQNKSPKVAIKHMKKDILHDVTAKPHFTSVRPFFLGELLSQETMGKLNTLRRSLEQKAA